MYGTVMIAKVKGSVDELQARSEAWAKEHGNGAGYIDEWVMQTDDGRIVVAVRFDSKENYLKLADDPKQDEWYRTQMMPMLDGEPQWIDGEWRSI
jgi:hypothetical protein